MNIPKGHQAVMVYLILDDAEKFLDFTKKAFGAELTYRGNTDDGSIMHAEINIGGSTIMFANAGDQWHPMTAGLFLYVDSADDSFNAALDAGAIVVMELSDKSYGRTCGIKDPCGNTWWLTSMP